MDTLKNRLDIAMKRAGKKQVDIIRDLGIPKASISQYLSGTSKQMDSERLYMISEYLHVNPVWLLGFDDTMNDTEKKLIEMFRALNQEGMEKVMDYISDLSNTGRYSLKCSQSQVV